LIFELSDMMQTWIGLVQQLFHCLWIFA